MVLKTSAILFLISLSVGAIGSFPPRKSEDPSNRRDVRPAARVWLFSDEIYIDRERGRSAEIDLGRMAGELLVVSSLAALLTGSALLGSPRPPKPTAGA